MSATRLLVLAFVRAHGRAHGYLVGQDLLAWNADKWANTKTGSIYHALRQLDKDGLLEAFEIAATDSTPGRTDYSITAAGEAEFHRLMNRALTVPEMRSDMLCAGLVLMSTLPRATVLDYLRARLDRLDAFKGDIDRANSAANWSGERALPPHMEALLSFWVHNNSCSRNWLNDLIGKIENGAYVFIDEDAGAFAAPSTALGGEPKPRR